MHKDFERGFDDNYTKQLHNAEKEIFDSFLPDPLVNDRRALIQDTLPAIREMARLEEQRKILGSVSRHKRTSRNAKFLHYFEAQDLYAVRNATPVLNTLCNVLQE